eukprot:CAMPEP_0175804926 /NCGR_PEP_ID=MMETSP0107_2-20121207/384_1 /TAXON_ID=195067 ORGANISM="Goniomonas pacifica, Strain CCMP1869" /NCGR_SAMPLE_ID=MMETSP0107_2 /ASSEMBLY_ACC=CAM_ASM_000203 /LENGTH=160 /DNA_ID=CAMNT_0017116315 /DNA_START=10 /DNA_END=492 /DNA_ORIENTATION=-
MAAAPQAISQTGKCHCGEVEYKVEGTVLFNGLCHCPNCTRARGTSPIHIIGVAPKTCVTITKGADKLTTWDNGGRNNRVFCSKCGCLLNQGPPGADFRAIPPTTFHISDGVNCKLPAEYQPKAHVNYENRTFDWNDDLPKFKTFPGPDGAMLNSDGSVKA